MDINVESNVLNDVEEILGKIRDLIKEKDIIDIIGQNFEEDLKGWEKLIDRKSKEPFTLVMLGEFKRGKSTIINALLGKELVPSSVSPETYTINEISYGPVTKVEAVLENGDRCPLTIEDITRDRLQSKMKLYPSKIAYLDIRDNSDILSEIRIVDTPGLSDLEELDKLVTDYLVNADAVMYAASSLQPFAETEQVYISSHIRPQRFGMFYMLVNMMDALNSKRDVDKIMVRFSKLCEQIIPNAFVYGISGADEFARKTKSKRPPDKGTREFYETQFLKFELSLKRDIVMQKDIIRTKRVLTMTENMIGELYAKLRVLADIADMDRKKLESKTQEFDEQCRHISDTLQDCAPKLHTCISEMQQETEKWMYEFFVKLRESILQCRSKDANGVDLFSSEDIDKYFYSYLMEKVGEAYRICIDCHHAKINEAVENLSYDLASRLGMGNLSNLTQTASAERLMMSMNKNVKRSVMNIKMMGSSDAFPTTTVKTFNALINKKKKTDIIDIALDNFDKIREDIVTDIKKVYVDLENKAMEKLNAICQYQADVGKEALDQVKEMMDCYDESTIEEAFGRANAVIEECIDILEKHQEKEDETEIESETKIEIETENI